MINSLKKHWDAWKVIAHKIGTFQSRILLSLVYLILLMPYGVLMTYMFKKNKTSSSNWKKAESIPKDIKTMIQQY